MKTQLINFGKKVTSELSKQSPTILSAIGVVGVFATAYFAGKATLEAEHALTKFEEIHEFDEEPPTFMDRVKVVAPCYIKPATAAVTTCACIICSHKIDLQRQAIAYSLLAGSNEARKELQNKVAETYGDNKLEKMRDDIVSERVQRFYPSNADHIIESGKGETLFMDARTGQLLKSDWEHVKRAFIELENDINSGQEVTYNDYMLRVGFRPIAEGNGIFWEKDATGIMNPRYTTAWADEDKLISCTAIGFYTDPISSYEEV